MPYIAKIFESGSSQAVQLPKDFRFDVDEVEVLRKGDVVILRPKPMSTCWGSLHMAMERGFSPDFMAEGPFLP